MTDSRPWGSAALITGASSGIGEAFARALAARGSAVLLTAHPGDRERLCALAGELASRHGVRADALALDLAEPDGARRLQEAADGLGFQPDTLVNCAGLGAAGPFGAMPLEQVERIVHVNVEALVALTALYLPRMLARGHGAVVNVASTAALSPVPYFAVYAASKAFVLSFSEALWAECRRKGVRVVAVCPGPVETQFGARAGTARPRYQLRPEAVAAGALRALERDLPTVVQRVPVFGLVFAALTAPVGPRRLRLIAGERLARWFFRQA